MKAETVSYQGGIQRGGGREVLYLNDNSSKFYLLKAGIPKSSFFLFKAETASYQGGIQSGGGY